VRRLAAIAALAIAATLSSIPPAGAAAPSGTIKLVSQSSWVGEGGDFALRLRPAAKSPEDLELAVTIYPALTTRSDFDATLTDRVRGSAVSVSSTPLTELPADADGVVTVTLPIQSQRQPRDPAQNRIRLRGPGVYPVVVELRATGGGARADRFVTYLVNLPDAITGPRLAVALVLPMSAPLAMQPDGSRRTNPLYVSSLAAEAGAIDGRADVPVTLLPRPETLQSLSTSDRAADRDALVALGRTAAGRLVLGAPYVRLNETAYAAGLDSEETAQRRHGVDVASALLGVTPYTATAVIEDGADDMAANRLRDDGVERAVVRNQALTATSLRTTLTQPFLLRSRTGRHLTAAAADDGLATHFTDKAPPALAAQRLLADLAVLYFDSPGVVRGTVALPPAAWRPNADFLGAVLDGLRGNPILEPVDINTYFENVKMATSGRGPLIRDGATPTAGPLPATDLRRARRELGGLQGLTLAGEPPDVVAGLGERILASQSADLRSRQRSDYLDEALKAIRAQLRSIRLPADQSITLTARRGEIPITIQRGVGYPVRVIVQLSSDKLQFPEGASAVLDLVRRNTTQRFTVQARTSGTFPLTVTLRSPDRRVVLSTGRFTIRSRAASGVGVILSVSALCFLVLWWGRHIFQARRGRRQLVTA
jgi:hypothetical protein